MRDEYLGQMLLCLEGASCTSISQRTAFRACHDFVVTGLSVTKPLRHFCFEGSRRAARCNRAGDADQSDCLSRFRYVRDDALASAAECMKAPCEAVPQCMKERLVDVVL
jgi:hypothetical protein